MADFRKCFFAFAALALVTSFAVPASAQVAPALQCVANAGVPPTVRAEGLTELTGDLVLNCNGGTSTPANQVVPQANVTIFLSTNITSRLVSSPFSEALLLIDEPHSASNPGVPLQMCDSAGLTLGVCTVYGAPTGNGIGTFNPGVGGNSALGGTSVTRPNVFQGRQTAANQITFFGVPIDPPGTISTRVIRITNIRANANALGVSSTLVPTQITAYISVTGSTSVPVNNPQQTVAFVQAGLVSSIRSGTFTAPVSFIQCVGANSDVLANPAGNNLTGGGQTGAQFRVRFDEGFGTAWKVRNINQVIAVTGAAASTFPAGAVTATDVNQNVPGAIYNTEAGFQNNTVDPTPNPPGATGTGIVTAGNGSSTFTSSRNGNAIGVANSGTRLMATFNSVPNGVQLVVPTRVQITNQTGGGPTGYAVLVSTDANGAGGIATGGVPAISPSNTAVATSLGFGTNGGVLVASTNGTIAATYEVVMTDPFNLERLEVPIAVVFAANPGTNLPAPGVQSTVTTSFAPLSTVGTADASAPIPRFAPGLTPRNDFIINTCSCNVLFPFVSNQQGFDTGVAIANTSVDPFGTTPQSGIITLNYYGSGVAAGFSQPTNAVVPGGQELTFTLSGGGNFGIAATPGFQGYIIAQAKFQYCHAFAYISAQGALPTAPGASEGYLGIILDLGGLNRTGQLGEVQAH